MISKLEIQPLNPLTLSPSGGPIKVTFNPNSYSISKSVSWKTPDSSTGRGETQELLNAPKLTFGGGSSRILSINELLFDVTEPGSGNDVREKTNEIVALTRIDRSFKQPPACRVSWGSAPSGSDFPFDGVITDLTQTFTLFKKDGTPVRATLSVTFTEYIKPQDDQRKTDPELTTHTVKRGDKLSSIAAKLYGDPTRWRIIAEANSLDNPRQLEIGKILTIPEVD
ncbi:LysM peptidoglycan-binding domain-containing protein [Mastigocoleus sp. MO_188.B34]|uniref:CIS tube protein n=1 Tax=Mastigocoleus sp. MO_188.B34 TaxID=3036635 RepID=UPI00262CDA0B|nr:LysM peptidoglycan-binding domain-containing protein [Mastigocoleus sp. MO_188.B34]MDJ0693223.1 LysM peptidoglycan-binding domain-containing protein [Mastigocoleus sp. MO_188.B34]